MKTKLRILLVPITVFALAFLVGLNQAVAAPIYAINDGVSSHQSVVDAISDLTALGHTVSTGGTLSDYSAFDQVWDLRYNGILVSADVTAMGSYLAGGGRMYLTGAHDDVPARNASLVNWVSSIGGGGLTLVGWASHDSQTFTTEGEALLNNDPNSFSSIFYNPGTRLVTADTGFLATQFQSVSGVGSLVGWDFGDITGKSSARMLIGFGIGIFNSTNGQNWTENMYTFLAESVPEAEPVPESTTIALLGLGLAGLGFRARKKLN